MILTELKRTLKTGKTRFQYTVFFFKPWIHGFLFLFIVFLMLITHRPPLYLCGDCLIPHSPSYSFKNQSFCLAKRDLLVLTSVWGWREEDMLLRSMVGVDWSLQGHSMGLYTGYRVATVLLSYQAMPSSSVSLQCFQLSAQRRKSALFSIVEKSAKNLSKIRPFCFLHSVFTAQNYLVSGHDSCPIALIF